MKNISPRINPKPVPGLYFVSYFEYDYDEYDSFVVVANSQAEANMLTPYKDINHNIGKGLGYNCPAIDPEILRLYRNVCERGRSVRRIGDAWAELEWGDVLISSFNAG
jgi:hypothetical protein